MSVRHSTESKWRGIRAVLWYWSVWCTSQQQRQALENPTLCSIASYFIMCKVRTVDRCVRVSCSLLPNN